MDVKDVFNEKCTLCYEPLRDRKYICTMCLNYTMCAKCEQEHIHPVIRCTGLHLSTMPELYKYFKFHQLKNVKKPSIFFSNIFKKDQRFEFKLNALTTSITMGKYEQRSIRLTIENTMNVPFDQSLDLMLIARNIKDLKMEEMKINNSFNPRELLEYQAKVESRDKREYDVIFELYSSKVTVSANTLTVKIIVSENVADKELNDYFTKYPNISVLPKEQKETIKKLMEKKVTTEHPYIILSVCKNAKWNYEDSFKELQNMRNKNHNKLTNPLN